MKLYFPIVKTTSRDKGFLMMNGGILYFVGVVELEKYFTTIKQEVSPEVWDFLDLSSIVVKGSDRNDILNKVAGLLTSDSVKQPEVIIPAFGTATLPYPFAKIQAKKVFELNYQPYTAH